MVVDKLISYLDSQGKEIDDIVLGEVSILAAQAFERQFGQRKDSPSTPRLSSIGRCVRQQAYNNLGFEKNGKEIDARAKMVFFQGDLTELAIIELIKVAGLTVEFTGRNQKIVELDGVEGHPDGIFTNCVKKYLLEVKSMSSFSFADFQKGIIDEAYIYQINAYLEALGLDECVMIGLNKDAGVLHEHIVKKNPEIVRKVKENIQTIKAATKENLPPQPYQPDIKGYLPWQCRFCSFYKDCWPNSQLELVKNSYKLRVTNEQNLHKM